MSIIQIITNLEEYLDPLQIFPTSYWMQSANMKTKSETFKILIQSIFYTYMYKTDAYANCILMIVLEAKSNIMYNIVAVSTYYLLRAIQVDVIHGAAFAILWDSSLDHILVYITNVMWGSINGNSTYWSISRMLCGALSMVIPHIGLYH